ncbi:MAG TPA: xanthine dehydrogenase subunit D, partial [Candidatus Udaeobacter sp.]|nr:xanthine dehydrogenase subunit D [Candidatus Udaeobacter sp.]
MSVGRSVPRVDGPSKVTGEFEYASDLSTPGMLWGATVHAPHAHARIESIDLAPALAMPGVHAALTAKDVPGKATFGLEFADQPVFASSVVRFEGECVAVVAADTPELARQAAAAVRVDYRPLPALTDMEDALRPDAVKLHDFGNILRHVHIEHGDPEARADVWIEGYYETGMQDNAPLGPEAALAFPPDDGGAIRLWVNTQWLHVDRQQIAACLAIPDEKLRVTLAGVGGAFGAREDIHLQLHACLLAIATGRPVKMTYGREQSFRGHKHRHPSRIWARTGATKDGRLVSVRVRLLLDGGAYASSSPAVLANASTFAAGPYEVPNVVIDGTVVYTNNPPTGAMRGFGAPQVCFAHEGQMDRLASALGMHPLEVRRRNVLHTGSILPTGQPVHSPAPLQEIIRGLEAMPQHSAEPRAGRAAIHYAGGAGNVSRGEGLRRGVGYALGYKNVMYSEGFDDSGEARIKLATADGMPFAEIRTAAVDCGQGLMTVLTQIAQTELGVENVRFLPADTAVVGSAGSTSASRQTTMAGGAVKMACEAAMDGLREGLARRFGAGREGVTVSFDGRTVLLDGEPIASAAEVLSVPIERTAVYHHRPTGGFDERGQGNVHASFVFAGERAVVEVDTELGLVRVVEIAAVQDTGRAINPAGVEAQVEGGTAMGLGLAVMEELRLKDGKMLNPSFTDYVMPTTLDMPSVQTQMIEDPEPGAPYGLKGIGEAATIVATAAVVAAIRDATGIELNRAPVRPEDVAGLRPPARSDGWAPNPPRPWQRPVPELAGLAMGQQHLMSEKGVAT